LLVFGSINKVVRNQNPTTVELPLNAFSQLNGGNLFQVAQSQQMVAMYDADPALELVREFTNLMQAQN
jgi:hypothetical protein